ncbi:MAG: DMT family transporter [Micropepsaceae bacterium]
MAVSEVTPHSPNHQSARPLLGICLKVGATFAFTIMAVIARKLGQSIPVGEVVFFRSAFAFLPLFVWMVMRGIGVASLKTAHPWMHARRAFTGVCAMFTYFSALMFLPVADLTAIGFTSPLIVVMLAATMLGETVRGYRWSAVGVGFLGVLLMAWPHISGEYGDGAWVGVVLAFVNAVFVSFTMIFIRSMSGTEPALTIAFYFQFSCAAVSALTLPFVWVSPESGQLFMLIGLGILGGIGQLLMTNSYRFAPASTLANFDYAAMIWAIILGWIFFSETPHPSVYAGAAIVIGSGLFIAWRERQLELKEAAGAVSSA